jgi:sulfur-oxidizing protein SoxZ
MKNKIKIRAYLKEDIATIKAIIYHPMETGLRKDKETGKNIPAHYITEATAAVNGEEVLTCFWGSGVSKNPFLSFDLNGAKAGDKINISWVDNKGESASAEAQLD